MQEELAKLQAEREKAEADIAATKADQQRLKEAEEEAAKAKELHAKQAAELEKMKAEIAEMANAGGASAMKAQLNVGSGFKAVPDMIKASGPFAHAPPPPHSAWRCAH